VFINVKLHVYLFYINKNEEKGITDPTPNPKASPLSPLQGARGTSGAGRHRVRLR